LVQVNSLEQLISINQNLAAVLGAATTPTTPAGSVVSAGAKAKTNAAPPVQAQRSVQSSSLSAPRAQSGNLTIPKASSASQTVARSLDGRPRGTGHGHGIRDIPTNRIP
jgi:hypothetical protein